MLTSTSCTTSGKLQNQSEPQFSHLWNRINKSHSSWASCECCSYQHTWNGQTQHTLAVAWNRGDPPSHGSWYILCDVVFLLLKCNFSLLHFILANRKIGTGRSCCCQRSTPLGRGEEGETDDSTDRANDVSEPSATEEGCVVYRNLKGSLKGEPRSEDEGPCSYEPHWHLMSHPYGMKRQPDNKKYTKDHEGSF